MIRELADFLNARLHEETERPAALRTIAALIPDGQLLLTIADQIEADAQAKRGIVAGCERWLFWYDRGFLPREALLVVEGTLRSLATGYATHPEYQPEWGLHAAATYTATRERGVACCNSNA